MTQLSLPLFDFWMRGIAIAQQSTLGFPLEHQDAVYSWETNITAIWPKLPTDDLCKPFDEHACQFAHDFGTFVLANDAQKASDTLDALWKYLQNKRQAAQISAP